MSALAFSAEMMYFPQAFQQWIQLDHSDHIGCGGYAVHDCHIGLSRDGVTYDPERDGRCLADQTLGLADRLSELSYRLWLLHSRHSSCFNSKPRS